MTRRATEHGLEFLFGLHGASIFSKKAASSSSKSPGVPATANAPGGTRLVGFDSAHDVPASSSRSNAATKVPVEMKHAKVQNLRSLREEMKAVARGGRSAPVDASKPSFNSVEAIVRLLTSDNRRLLALIRDRKPRSVYDLVTMTGRAQPNLTRTLAKFEAAGFITMKTVGRRKAPSAAVKKIVVEIDPYSDRDRLRVA